MEMQQCVVVTPSGETRRGSLPLLKTKTPYTTLHNAFFIANATGSPFELGTVMYLDDGTACKVIAYPDQGYPTTIDGKMQNNEFVGG